MIKPLNLRKNLRSRGLFQLVPAKKRLICVNVFEIRVISTSMCGPSCSLRTPSLIDFLWMCGHHLSLDMVGHLAHQSSFSDQRSLGTVKNMCARGTGNFLFSQCKKLLHPSKPLAKKIHPSTLRNLALILISAPPKVNTSILISITVTCHSISSITKELHQPGNSLLLCRPIFEHSIK